ncbi:hypothetical protein BGX21_002987 [Mortierella sp. AD011]|nr:hypothetical protein BGX20_005182 [Mortierella sp. AD010]KAF9400996.1 hypothetical protein BGX21_002987 [Mortierella sp. AD011]
MQNTPTLPGSNATLMARSSTYISPVKSFLEPFLKASTSMPLTLLQQLVRPNSIKSIQSPAAYPSDLPSSTAGWANLGMLDTLMGPVSDSVTTFLNLHSLALGQNFFTTGDPSRKFMFYSESVMNGTGNTTTPIPSINSADVVPPASAFLDTFARLSRLRQLKLGLLSISEGILSSWQQKMVSLTMFDLSNNSMQGQINGFSGLKTLLLDRNEFGRPISSLDSLKSLSGCSAI